MVVLLKTKSKTNWNEIMLAADVDWTFHTTSQKDLKTHSANVIN